MKPLVYIVSIGLVLCAIGGCSPKPGESGDDAFAGESPAASLTAEEASAYASYSPNLAGDARANESESVQSQ
jgi:hypothetical protein